MKRMIIRNGFKVFPSELEKLFSQHPAVERCVVVGVPSENETSGPKVHIVLKKEFSVRTKIK